MTKKLSCIVLISSACASFAMDDQTTMQLSKPIVTKSENKINEESPVPYWNYQTQTDHEKTVTVTAIKTAFISKKK